MLRRLFVVLGLVPLLAQADRLITVPMSIKVPFHTYSLTGLYNPADKATDGWLGYGFDKHAELELIGSDNPSNRSKFSGSISYQILPSLEDVAPGLALGVQDIASLTARGRVAYLAFTYRMTNYGANNQEVPTELNFGLWSYDKGLVYFGAKLPLTNDLWLLGEHDGNQLNFGASYRVGESAIVRYLFMSGRPTLGLTLRTAF